MNFQEIRIGVLKLDSEASDLKSNVMAEMALNGENKLLFKIAAMCADIQQQINEVKIDIQDIEMEEQTKMLEEWEGEQMSFEDLEIPFGGNEECLEN